MSFKSNVNPKNQKKGYGLPPDPWICPACTQPNKSYMASCIACKTKRPEDV